MSEWYEKGLRFKCTGCGKCCTGGPGLVWVSEEEITLMAQHLGKEPALFKRQFLRKREGRWALVEKKTFPHDCIFLKDKKCSIYEARPTQCRTYPWWKENLNSEESWRQAAASCEGINLDAPVVSYLEIKKHYQT